MAEVDMMQKVIAALISLLVIVVIMYLGPGIGEAISEALPICKTGENASAFADATTGADVWTSNVAIVSVVILIVIVSYAIMALAGLRGGKME